MQHLLEGPGCSWEWSGPARPEVARGSPSRPAHDAMTFLFHFVSLFFFLSTQTVLSGISVCARLPLFPYLRFLPTSCQILLAFFAFGCLEWQKFGAKFFRVRWMGRGSGREHLERFLFVFVFDPPPPCSFSFLFFYGFCERVCGFLSCCAIPLGGDLLWS